jgi:hypothetical protein
MAALGAVAQGSLVGIIEPTSHVGGILTSGLCTTDAQVPQNIGGYAGRFYKDLGTYYGLSKPSYKFEPHVAEQTFNSFLKNANVLGYLGRYIANVAMNGTTIVSVTLDNGLTLTAKQWIDASYEGDLMAAAGATYTVGREATAQYGESQAGWGRNQSLAPVSPLLPSGQVIPGINQNPNEATGAADSKIMAYTFRACLTTKKSDLVPFPKPAGYSSNPYQGLARFIATKQLTELEQIVNMEPTVKDKFDLLCAAQTFVQPDFNPFSTNFVGGGWKYPDASRTQRQAILQNHYNYVAGWLYFVAHDPSIPSSIQTKINHYGLPKDEFTDNNHWPWQMYVREGRRLVGQYVMTEADVKTDTLKTDSVGIGNWPVDGHLCDAFATTYNVAGAAAPAVGFDGAIGATFIPYEIPFRCILPNQEEVTNLAVTCCLSASHVGFCSLRVEPTFMNLGEAAGRAAGLAISSNTDFAGIDIATLQSALKANGVLLNV